MIRVTVSQLESFRYYWGKEDADMEQFIRELLHGTTQTPQMLAGVAFHEALEHAHIGEISQLKAKGYTFTFAGDFEVQLPVIRELRGEKTYMVDDEKVIVRGRVDGIEGLRVDDHKTTERFDADRYFEGYQWRLYLDMFEAKAFRWNVFEMRNVGELEYEIFGQQTLEQHSYKDLHADCLELVTQFARFYRSYVAPRLRK